MTCLENIITDSTMLLAKSGQVVAVETKKQTRDDDK
jgi:hypothetical protein